MLPASSATPAVPRATKVPPKAKPKSVEKADKPSQHRKVEKHHESEKDPHRRNRSTRELGSKREGQKKPNTKGFTGGWVLTAGLLGIGAIGLLVCGGVGLWLIFGRNTQPTPTSPALAAASSHRADPEKGGPAPPVGDRADDVEAAQALFARALEADSKNDDRGFLDCFTPDIQKFDASLLALMSMNYQSAYKNDPQSVAICKPVVEIMDKHGLSYEVMKKLTATLGKPGAEDKSFENLMEAIKDPATLYSELCVPIAKIENVGRKRDPKAPAARLTDLTRSRDTVTGKVVYTENGKEKSGGITILKSNGTWKISGPLNIASAIRGHL